MAPTRTAHRDLDTTELFARQLRHLHETQPLAELTEEMFTRTVWLAHWGRRRVRDSLWRMGLHSRVLESAFGELGEGATHLELLPVVEVQLNELHIAEHASQLHLNYWAFPLAAHWQREGESFEAVFPFALFGAHVIRRLELIIADPFALVARNRKVFERRLPEGITGDNIDVTAQCLR